MTTPPGDQPPYGEPEQPYQQPGPTPYQPPAQPYQQYQQPYGQPYPPYGGYPMWMLVVFGWLMVVGLIVAAFAAARVRWREGTALTDPGDRAEEVS